MMFRSPLWLLLGFLGTCPAPGSRAADHAGEAVIKGWLATNSRIEHLKVRFTQTRKLTSLKRPIRDKGVLWLDRKEKTFRWQIGEPPKAIVVGRNSSVLIVRPEAKKYERRSEGGENAPAWSVLARGFPSDWEEFQQKYRILKVTPRGDSVRVMTQPLDEAARGVRTFVFVIDSATHRLEGMAMTLRDGSTQEIDFTEIVLNVPLSEELLAPDLSGYRLTD